MNTRIVEPRTIWAVLAMEAALLLPLISLPTQGDRVPGMAGPLLLILLLPGGYVSVYQFKMVRDPSWRLLIGIAAALLTRALVSAVPDQDNGLLVWLGRSVVPAVIGVALWWRGGALAVAEITPYEFRTEFSLLALCMLVALGLLRPFLLPDPLLLGGSVGVFALAGLIGAVLSRQDAAEVAAPRFSSGLAVTTGLLPAGVAVVLVGSLRPELLTSMWLLLGRLIELLLTPIGLLIGWLVSLLPRRELGPPPTPMPFPAPPPPDPAALADAQERMAWVAWLIIGALVLAAAAAALIAARMLLSNFIGDPRKGEARPDDAELVVEPSGAARDDAANVFLWLLRWLRTRLSGGTRAIARRGAAHASDAGALDAWTAYQRLLSWAEQHGLARRPAETTGQLSSRLASYAPEAAEAVDLVTRTYEWERYGAIHPPRDRLRRVQGALESLTIESTAKTWSKD